MSTLHLVTVDGSTHGPYMARARSAALDGYDCLTVTHTTAQQIVVDLNADKGGLTARWDGRALLFTADAQYAGEPFAHTVHPDGQGHYTLPNMWPWALWEDTQGQSSDRRAYAHGARGQAAPPHASLHDRLAWQLGRQDALALAGTPRTPSPRWLSPQLDSVPDDFDVLIATGLDGAARVTVHPRCPQAAAILPPHGLTPAASAGQYTVPAHLDAPDVLARACADLVQSGATVLYLPTSPLAPGAAVHDVTFRTAPYGIVATAGFDLVAKHVLEQAGFRSFSLNYGLHEAMYKLPRDTPRPLAAVERAYNELIGRGRSIAVHDLLCAVPRTPSPRPQPQPHPTPPPRPQPRPGPQR
ncbi:hypothetical protein ACFYVL_09450 [Streptomyces sp. NPDC004111]|uniref:hypothetical protein n=1 Tax=Streptomyces sp. NPDC004111 TaxID=3364690 RepID=UPI00368B78EA